MFPTGLGEVIVTPPLALPPGRDLAPDLVLGLDLCDVFRLLDLPTFAPFCVSDARCHRILQTRSSSLLPWHRKGTPVASKPYQHAEPQRGSKGSRQTRSRMRVVPGMRLLAGQ